MNTQLVGQTWDKISGQHEEVITKFYQRFFDTYPDYRQHFPESLDRQMTKMVDTIALLARVSDETELAHSQMTKLGHKHIGYRIGEQDLQRFQDVFLQVLSEYCGDEWSDECSQAWEEVFNQHIIPHMMQGMQAH